MSELVPAASKSAALPLEGTEELRAGADHLAALLKSDSIDEVELGMKDLPAIARVIAAAERPASESELGRELAMLIAAFPNSKADVGFSAVLIRYAADMRPSIGAVMLTRRHFICSAKFLPAISEVREIIEKKTRFIVACKKCVDGMPGHLAWLKSKEAEERERQERYRRLERERKEQREREELERQRERKAQLEQEQRERKARNEAFLRKLAEQRGEDVEDMIPF